MKNYDIIVIGSGGGAKIVSPAARLGLKVAVIEKEALGGTCLNRGCIPSKMLIHPADVAIAIREAKKFDLHVEGDLAVDFSRLITRISQTVDGDSQKIAIGYQKNPNIDFYHTEGRFVANKTIRVDETTISADKIFLAVGARPRIPPIPGLTGTPFMTSTKALRNTRLPKSMVVVGGGLIAVELGHAYGAFGTDVHFLVRHRLLPREDAELAEEFSRIFSKAHHVHLGVVPGGVEFSQDRFTISYQNTQGQNNKITVEALLVATGVMANTDQLGLETTDIKLNEQGFIQVDDYLQTSVKDVYALGDCTGRYLYRHSVNFEGEHLMRTLFIEKSPQAIRYPPMPHAVFTHPQVAGVGKTEEELKKEGVDYVVGLNPYAKSAMGMARLSDHGFVKILIERKNRKILGAHIVGDEASDMIHMIIALMTKDGTLDDLLNMIYIHPSLPEIVRNAARNAYGELKQNHNNQIPNSKQSTIPNDQNSKHRR